VATVVTYARPLVIEDAELDHYARRGVVVSRDAATGSWRRCDAMPLRCVRAAVTRTWRVPTRMTLWPSRFWRLCDDHATRNDDARTRHAFASDVPR
jgi:hypothetical protein